MQPRWEQGWPGVITLGFARTHNIAVVSQEQSDWHLTCLEYTRLSFSLSALFSHAIQVT